MGRMATAHSNGLELEYEDFGDPGAPPLLLIMGLGAQLIDWPLSVSVPPAKNLRSGTKPRGVCIHLSETARLTVLTDDERPLVFYGDKASRRQENDKENNNGPTDK